MDLPLTSLLGGVAVGLGCSGGRRVSIITVVTTALVPVTGIGLLIDTAVPAAVSAMAYAALAAGLATVARSTANTIRRRTR